MCIRDRFSDIINHINAGDALVRNTTRVIPARLYGHRRDTGGSMEFLLLKRIDKNHWEALVKPGRKAVSYTHLTYIMTL